MRLVPILEAICIAALLFMWGLVATSWNELPSRVPQHFGLSGAPDRWGARNAILILPCVAVFLYIGLTVTARFPRSFNLPRSMDRNHPEVPALLTELLAVTKTIAVLTFAYIVWATIQMALGGMQGLGRWFMPAAVAIASLVPVLYMLKLRRYRA